MCSSSELGKIRIFSRKTITNANLLRASSSNLGMFAGLWMIQNGRTRNSYNPKGVEQDQDIVEEDDHKCQSTEE
jgi:hypothetical protein